MSGGDRSTLRVDRFGERALLVHADDQASVHALAAALVADLEDGRIEDVVPTDRTLLLRFDGTDAGERMAREALRAADERRHRADWLATRPRPRHRTIPVCYGGANGPDLDETAAIAGLSTRELIARHAGGAYTVLFLGFAPGFPYLGGLPAGLAVPRLTTPRTETRRGSVAIAEGYSGIYPANLPGGWRVIGWTPVLLFDPAADPPTYLLPGDEVRFEAVDEGDLPAEPYRPADWAA